MADVHASRLLASRVRLPRRIREVVIVSPACDGFGEFVAAAERGDVGLHICIDGRSAMRLARRFHADVWLVAAELPDMSAFDLLAILVPCVEHGTVDPLLGGAVVSLDHLGEGLRPGIFIVAETYRSEDEQRALSGAAAGYLTGPVTLDLLDEAR